MRRILLVILAVLVSTAFGQMTWTCATESAPWGPRDDHASVVFDGKMWVLGGARAYYPDTLMNDVWCSTNGVDWTCVNDSAPWSPRGPEAVVFDNKMWVVGGWRTSSGGGLDDVWYSTDGDSWVLATAHAGWAARGGHGLAVFGGKMWLMAGWVSGGMRDVRWSTDGVNWTLAHYPAQWPGRYYPGVAVFDNKMWVMGGIGEMNDTCLNDVWWSADGDSWTKATDAAAWSPRAGHGLFVFDGKMWVLGGMPDPPWTLWANDAWYSTDGVGWVCATDSAAWVPRAGHSALVYDGLLWVAGGNWSDSSLTLSDVWHSNGLGIEEVMNDERGTMTRGATVLSRLPTGAAVFDAMGRKVISSKPGVYFVRQQVRAQAGAQTVRKVLVTR